MLRTAMEATTRPPLQNLPPVRVQGRPSSPDGPPLHLDGQLHRGRQHQAVLPVFAASILLRSGRVRPQPAVAGAHARGLAEHLFRLAGGGLAAHPARAVGRCAGCCRTRVRLLFRRRDPRRSAQKPVCHRVGPGRSVRGQGRGLIE